MVRGTHWFSAAMLVSSKPSTVTAPGPPVPSSSLQGYCHTWGIHIQKHTYSYMTNNSLVSLDRKDKEGSKHSVGKWNLQNLWPMEERKERTCRTRCFCPQIQRVGDRSVHMELRPRIGAEERHYRWVDHMWRRTVAVWGYASSVAAGIKVT